MPRAILVAASRRGCQRRSTQPGLGEASPGGGLGAGAGHVARLEANVAANGFGDRIRTLRTAAGDAVGEFGFS